MIRGVIFDLDDTLYDEAEYVRCGFRAVAARIAERSGVDSERIFAFLQAELRRSGRGRIFDAALQEFGMDATSGQVAELVAVYRACRPVLDLYPDAVRLLEKLSGRWRIGIVTDGLPQMQRAKLDALKLSRYADSIVCCWEHAAPKPDPSGFRLIMEQWNLPAQEIIVIGDRPDHDMAAAAALGMPSMRVHRGRFAGKPCGPHVPDYEIDSLDEVIGIIAASENAICNP
jgi:putative hydrolase of the HAD superfamily